MNLMIVPCLYKEKQMRKHMPKPLLIAVQNFCCTAVVGIWIHNLVRFIFVIYFMEELLQQQHNIKNHDNIIIKIKYASKAWRTCRIS